MSDKEKPSRKTTIHDFFIKIVESLNLSELPKYEKLNLLLSAILGVVALALALPPVLVLVNNIIISIGNVIIVIFGKTEHIQAPNTSVSLTIILPLVLVFIESILCLILCFFYKKLNSTPSNDPDASNDPND